MNTTTENLWGEFVKAVENPTAIDSREAALAFALDQAGYPCDADTIRVAVMETVGWGESQHTRATGEIRILSRQEVKQRLSGVMYYRAGKVSFSHSTGGVIIGPND